MSENDRKTARGWSGRQSHSVQFADLCVQGSVTGVNGGGGGSLTGAFGSCALPGRLGINRRVSPPGRSTISAPAARRVRHCRARPRRRRSHRHRLCTPGSRGEMWSPVATAASLYSHSTYFGVPLPPIITRVYSRYRTVPSPAPSSAALAVACSRASTPVYRT